MACFTLSARKQPVMGRPSCCKPRSQAPGVAAVVLIIGAGILAGKSRHIADRVLHDVAEVLRIAAVTTGAIAAAAITAWIVILLVRWHSAVAKPRPGHAKVARARADIAASLASVLDDERAWPIYAMHGQQAPARPARLRASPAAALVKCSGPMAPGGSRPGPARNADLSGWRGDHHGTVIRPHPPGHALPAGQDIRPGAPQRRRSPLAVPHRDWQSAGSSRWHLGTGPGRHGDLDGGHPHRLGRA